MHYVYYNFHKRLFSIMRNGKVVGHAPEVMLESVEFRVRPGGRARALHEGRKSVHAFVIGVPCLEGAWNERANTAVTYNYRKYASFVLLDGTPIYKAEYAWLRIHNKRPEIWVEKGN